NDLCDKALELAGHVRSGVIGPGQIRAAARDLGWPGAETDGVVGLTNATAKPTLTLSHDGEVIAIYPLEQERTLIGREADNEVPIDSPYVSRHHTLIVRDELGFWITDINSTNGTYLNGNRVSNQVRLGPGDHIRIGRHELIISMPGEKRSGLRGTARLHDGGVQTVVDPLSQEDPERALSELERAIAENPDKIELQFERGCLLTDLDRKDEAIAAFDQLLRRQAGIPEAHNNLAVLLAENGDLLRARAELEKAIRLSPAYSCAHENLGDIYLQLASTSYEAALDDSADKDNCRRKITGLTRVLRD
ncbi:MAG: FHA domain-containing protein, partial [Gammaproteobacteria bacterium]|nr:FHA domain-containing protein [Gammaproteobacteria bacterium]